MLLHRSDLNISAKVRQFFGVFKLRNYKKLNCNSFHFFQNSSRFLLILLKFGRNPGFSRKCRETLQLLDVSRFQLNSHHDYTGDLFNFRPNFLFNFQFHFNRAAPLLEGVRADLAVLVAHPLEPVEGGAHVLGAQAALAGPDFVREGVRELPHLGCFFVAAGIYDWRDSGG